MASSITVAGCLSRHQDLARKSYSVADALARHGIPFGFSTGYGDHGNCAEFADRPPLRKPYVRSALVVALVAPVTPDPLGMAA